LENRFARDLLHHLGTRGHARPQWADAIEAVHVRVRVTAIKETTGWSASQSDLQAVNNDARHEDAQHRSSSLPAESEITRVSIPASAGTLHAALNAAQDWTAAASFRHTV
jgi:hypothetical protein